MTTFYGRVRVNTGAIRGLAAAVLITGATALSGCVAAVPLAATAVGVDLFAGGVAEAVTEPAAANVRATRTPSPVKGPLRCYDKRVAGGKRLTCEGGVPGHAKWCNDVIRVSSPGSTSLVLGALGQNQDQRVIRKHCVNRVVPPEIAALQ